MKLIWCLFLFLLITQLSRSQDFFEWRGLGRTGIFNETGLLKKWLEGGPELLWSVNDLPKGYSSVSIGNGTLFLTGLKDSTEVLLALDSKGNKKWETGFGRAWDKTYPESRSTPTYDHEKVYAVSGLGDIACADANSGKILWTVKTHEKFSSGFGRWGMAESPLIVDDKLIFTPCGDKTTVIALNKITGETVWISECLNENAVYASSILIERNGKKLIIALTGNYILGVDPTDGKITWKFEFGKYVPADAGRNNHATTPLYADGNLYVTSGYNHSSVMLKLTDDLTNASLLWVDDVLDNHYGGVVHIGSYIYGANWLNNSMGKWVCLDWKTGKAMYETQWINKGSIISADGLLYCYEEKTGNMALVIPSPERFEVISSFKVPLGSGPHWAHPVICNGILYIRHGETLMAYHIKVK
jgi:hypothetical protein